MSPSLSPTMRRLILGSAFLAATLCAFLPDSPAVHAAETATPPAPSAVTSVPAPAATTAGAEAAREATREARDAAREARDAVREAAAEARVAAREAAREAKAALEDANDESSSRKGIHVGIDGLDRNYGSFNEFVDAQPALAVMVFGIVFIMFLTPVLIIGLVVWYKIRKSRMLNETMLKLAEKGIVPTAETLDALQSGRPASAFDATGATSALPMLDQARAMRTRAADSDLRKGVLLGAVGLAWTLYSIFEDRTPNWLSLVLLFVGAGYAALAYFEHRQAASIASAVVPHSRDAQN